jgi:hypothetical protein
METKEGSVMFNLHTVDDVERLMTLARNGYYGEEVQKWVAELSAGRYTLSDLSIAYVILERVFMERRTQEIDRKRQSSAFTQNDLCQY